MLTPWCITPLNPPNPRRSSRPQPVIEIKPPRIQGVTDMSIHVAITRRVRPGCEAEFQKELRGFFQASFDHGSVLGASMISPLAGEDPQQYGILRTFVDEMQRDAFYASPLFAEWNERAKSM